ncbi:hypothetical protein ACTWPB_07420 [Nocardia sp. IBHARD005]|uniref:hypothetical protein n=1 Tax=Nocardia sp. IBHARD005 TaxID=3457765 RepID=UPI0040593B08
MSRETESVHGHLVRRFLVSMQHTKADRDFAAHLAHCIASDHGLGVVNIARDAAWNGTGLSWMVAGVAELAVGKASDIVGVALFKRQLTVAEARHLAAQLLDAAREAEAGPVWEKHRVRMAAYRPRTTAAAEPTDLLDLLGAL